LLDDKLSNLLQERVESGVQHFLFDRPFAIGVNVERRRVCQLIGKESFFDLLL
jgi:hypothetical protein